MLLFLEILILLWMVNLAPPVSKVLLGDRWNLPVDFGRSLGDGERVLGANKTYRGLAGAVAAGMLLALLFRMPVWVGAVAAVLSMAGDLTSSFIKRRMGWRAGKTVPGLDQFFEGIIPLLFLGRYYDQGAVAVVFLLLLFGAGAYAGSRFFYSVLHAAPFRGYPRPVNPTVRLKELRSCQIKPESLYYWLNFEHAVYYHLIMSNAIRAFGLYDQGVANALDVRLKEVSLEFANLPAAFDGFSILFLTDLHIDGLEGLDRRVVDLVRDRETDLCLLGGDYRMETYGDSGPTLRRLAAIIGAMRPRLGVYGILGNHDCPEMVEPLIGLGVQVLINERVEIRRGEERIWLAGLDDPHLYRCDDCRAALEGVPADDFTILAVHSPETYREAARWGVDLYLCGHTHAGQIQFPQVGPLFSHSRAPRRFIEGTWSHEGMTGYTSAGVGASGLPVRFGTVGEVVVITLRSKAPAA